MKVHLRAYGAFAYMVSAPGLGSMGVRRYLDRRFLDAPPCQFVEHVWGATTLLVILKTEVAVAQVRRWFAEIETKDAENCAQGSLHEVVVHYDGPDLKSVAKRVGVSSDELITMHSTPIYTVRMMGFSPGFPYLDGLDERLHLERRAQPRQRITAGSVAIGGPHAGIYSVSSPGGWHILGHTQMPLFKAESAMGQAPVLSEVFAFQPGDRIRFIPKQA